MPRAYRKVFTIIRGAGVGKKDRWVTIGVSFTNKDGSESVILHALPLDGRLQLRTPKAKASPTESAGS